MSGLVVRRLPFDFADVRFDWNPANRPFAMVMNAVSFQAISFETYRCRAVRDAERFFTDPDVTAEAKAFRGQEMAHSIAHKKHVKALVERYPGLQDVLDESIAGFDELYKSEDLHFHLAYAANIEATFTPLFGTIINYREQLFGGGDPRVTALMLWHFCEEIEHRSSALNIYNHVVGNRVYRLTQLPKVLRHITANARSIHSGFRKYVGDVRSLDTRGAFARIPLWPRTRMMLGILDSQMPWHRPEHGAIPPYFHDWISAYEHGEDMTLGPAGLTSGPARPRH